MGVLVHVLDELLSFEVANFRLGLTLAEVCAVENADNVRTLR